MQDGLNLKQKPKHCDKYIQCIIRVFLSLPCKVIQHWQGKAKLSTSCEADQEDHPFNSGFCATASFSCPLGWEATLSSVAPKLKYFSRAFRSFYGYAIKHVSGERLLKQFPVTEGKMRGATNSGMIDRQIALYCYTVPTIFKSCPKMFSSDHFHKTFNDCPKFRISVKISKEGPKFI